MTNFDSYLKKFRDRISQGGLQKLKEDIAAGRIAHDKKVRAANFAIKEAEEKSIFPTHVPTDTFKNKISRFAPDWFKAIWLDSVGSNVIGGIILAVLTALTVIFINWWPFNTANTNPDGLYQGGREICIVTGAELRPTTNTKIVNFKSIRCKEIPDFKIFLEYRNLALTNCKWENYTGLDLTRGEKARSSFKNVTCAVRE